VTSPQDDRPIFEAEKAPPTLFEQLRTAFTPRRGHFVISERPGPKGVLIGIGKALLGSVGGVMMMLGALGLGMTVLLGLYVIITKVGGGDLGVQWQVVPMSLVLFGIVGGIGFLILRSMGMFVRTKR
jgi:hypothetical protein